MSSYTSSAILSEGSAPSTSPTSQASAAIGFMPSPAVAIPTSAPMSRSSSQSSQAGFPGLANWTYGSAHRRTSSSTPSAYVSDEDLFGDDVAVFMSEPPPVPRTAEQWAMGMRAAPPPPPPVQQTKSRTSSIAVSSRRRTSSVQAQLMKQS